MRAEIGGPGEIASRAAHTAEVAARERGERSAVRVVAARSLDVDDCRELLGMLGLTGAAGLPTDRRDLS
jgi:hypothetical protein